MKIKINIWGFSGAKSLKKPACPTKEDLQFAKITYTDNNIHLTREFDGMKDRIITIADHDYGGKGTYHFMGLTRFFYKDYCCVIDKNNYTEIK